MATDISRREILKGSLAAAGLGVLGIPEWAVPALAQGETPVAFTDIPERSTSRRRQSTGCWISGRSTGRSRRAISSSRRSTWAIPRSTRRPSVSRSRGWWSARRRCRSTSSARWGRPTLSPGSSAPATASVAIEGTREQRPLDGRAASRRAGRGGSQGRRTGGRLLRRRSSGRGRRVPRATLQGRSAVRPQPPARAGALAPSRSSRSR